MIGWIVLPQVGNLPLWCSGAGRRACWPGAAGWRCSARPLPGSWWVVAPAGADAGRHLATHRTLLGRDAGVTLIVVLLALKTLELRARRDAFVIFFLGFFTMLTNFFFSQSLLTAAAMLVALLGLLTALVNAHMPVGKPPLAAGRPHRRLDGPAGRADHGRAVRAVPALRAAVGHAQRRDERAQRPVGQHAGGQHRQAGAGRRHRHAREVRRRRVPPQSDLYFRGPVLSTFDGREWRALQPSRAAACGAGAQLQVSGTPVRYEVTLEPNNRPWLLVLDAAAQAARRAGLRDRR